MDLSQLNVRWIELSMALSLLVVISLYIRFRGNSSQEVEGAKTEFVSLASHYLLTPLSVIRGTVSELRLDRDRSVTELQTMYGVIESNANKLLLIIQNMMTVAAIDQGILSVKSQPVDLIQLVTDCIALVDSQAREKGVAINFERPTLSVSQIHGDPEKLKQAINNVLDNSVKFTGQGGMISVAVSELKNMDATGFAVRIADSGVGISSVEMKKLFTRFHRGTDFLRLNYEGMGLGLYIAKYLIEANGGTLTLDSGEGKGTVADVVFLA